MKNTYPKKTIRSYVKRQSRITNRQEQAYETLWTRYGLSCVEKLNLDAVFVTRNPIIFEIGFGMGKALLEMAKQRPDCNFIGIEVHKPGIGAVLAEIEQQGLTNIRIFDGDVHEILQKAVPNESLTEVYILFPDPWPKRRHHKRRLIQSEFINLLSQKIKKGGTLHLATDIEDYAEQMMEVITSSNFNNENGLGNFCSNSNLRPSTKFENRGLARGHGIWDLRFIKS